MTTHYDIKYQRNDGSDVWVSLVEDIAKLKEAVDLLKDLRIDAKYKYQIFRVDIEIKELEY